MSAQRQPRHLDDYVRVHSRVEEFRQAHPTARLITNIIKDEPLTVRCEIYLDGNDSGIPNSSGMADEHGGMGNRGKMLEKIETAAAGRALAFLGYGIREGLASQEDMDARPRNLPPKQIITAPNAPPNVRAVSPTDDPQLVEDSYAILEAAETLGYDGAKVRKWINQKYEVTEGINSLTPHDRKEVLEIFRAQANTKQDAQPPATAQNLADLVTPKQLGMIRALARERELDPDAECLRVLGCRIEELSKRGASGFIDHLKEIEVVTS